MGFIFILMVLFLLFNFPTELKASQDNGFQYIVGQEIPPQILEQAESISANQVLSLDDTYNLFLSNCPEMPVESGVLCRVDDVLSEAGKVRVLFSHLNLLIDWRQDPIANIPATVGFAVENHSNKKISVYASGGAMAANLSPEGVYHFLEDAAPENPETGEVLYFGTAVGNYLVKQWYLSQTKPPEHLGTIEPEGRLIISGDVGARGWVTGMYDLQFFDYETDMQLARSDFAPGESVGIRTFIARMGENLEVFLDERDLENKVLQPKSNLHMRGLFQPGNYLDNPSGEAVSKTFKIDYNAYDGGMSKFALAAGRDHQAIDPSGLNYVPDVFINDCMRNGFDPYTPGIKGVNGGNYGVDYSIEIEMNGPTALVLQGALENNKLDKGSFIDLYNQMLTYRLDGLIRTVFLKDPNYHLYYSEPSALRPQGYGKVIGVYPHQGKHIHTLNFTLPPNSYGPVRFYLLPLQKFK